MIKERRPPPPPFREVKEDRKPPKPPACRLIESWVFWPSKKKEKCLTTEEKLAYALATLEALKSVCETNYQISIIDKALKTLKEK